jgi:phospholipase/carboxylesterase
MKHGHEMNLPLRHIFQPADHSSNQLLIVLHGLGDSAEGFLGLRDLLSIESLNYLLLTAPTPYYLGFSWYDLPPNQLPGILRSRELLTEVFAATAFSGYPPERTFLLGFSQGCLMTLEFGARHVHRLGGYVGISGYSNGPGALLRELNPEVNNGNWLVTHGSDDELLPVERTRSQMKMLNDAGFKIDYREYRKAHTLDLRRELPDIRDWLRARTAQL